MANHKESPKKFGRDDLSDQIQERPLINQDYPDISEDINQKEMMQFQKDVGHHRRTRQFSKIEKEEKEEEQLEPPKKRCKVLDLQELQELHDDYAAKQKARDEARVLWRSAVESLQCLKDPGQDYEDKEVQEDNQ